MGWELIKQTEIGKEGPVEKEYLQETKVRTTDPVTTRKLWRKDEAEREVQEIDAAILELQERKAVILEQMEKFTVEAIPK